MNDYIFNGILAAYNELGVSGDSQLRKHLGMALRRAVLLHTEQSVNTEKKLGSRLDVLTSEEIRVGRDVGKLQAIKLIRERTKCSLIDGKNALEDYFSKHNIRFMGT